MSERDGEKVKERRREKRRNKKRQLIPINLHNNNHWLWKVSKINIPITVINKDELKANWKKNKKRKMIIIERKNKFQKKKGETKNRKTEKQRKFIQ